MRGSTCEEVKDLLADVAAGALPPDTDKSVRDHLRSCADCRAELELLRGLREDLTETGSVPEGLESRIQARVRDEFGEALAEGATPIRPEARAWGRRRVPLWTLSAAAVTALALGTGIIWNRVGTNGGLDPLAVASQEPLPEAWLWDDGLVAGAPVFDGLSDEDLEALLREFEGS